MVIRNFLYGGLNGPYFEPLFTHFGKLMEAYQAAEKEK